MHRFSCSAHLRQLLAGLALILSLALCAVAGRMSSTATLATADGASAEQRFAYISSLGWVVSPSEAQEQVQLPDTFSTAYIDYLALQTECGFDLTPYAGQTVTRYTYPVTNYPNFDQAVYLDLLVYEQQIIGGDVRAASLDGFMQSLNYPS